MISKVFERVLKVYPDELKVFLWVTSILFIMRVSGILLNNYAQTAFLKRFGVEYLPHDFLINAILVFFVGNFIAVLMDRFNGHPGYTDHPRITRMADLPPVLARM